MAHVREERQLAPAMARNFGWLQLYGVDKSHHYDRKNNIIAMLMLMGPQDRKNCCRVNFMQKDIYWSLGQCHTRGYIFYIVDLSLSLIISTIIPYWFTVLLCFSFFKWMDLLCMLLVTGICPTPLLLVVHIIHAPVHVVSPCQHHFGHSATSSQHYYIANFNEQCSADTLSPLIDRSSDKMWHLPDGVLTRGVIHNQD